MQQGGKDDDGAVVRGAVMDALDGVEMEREGQDAADVGPVVRGVVDGVGHPFLGEGTYKGYKSAVGGRRDCGEVRLRGHGGRKARSKRRVRR